MFSRIFAIRIKQKRYFYQHFKIIFQIHFTYNPSKTLYKYNKRNHQSPKKSPKPPPIKSSHSRKHESERVFSSPLSLSLFLLHIPSLALVHSYSWLYIQRTPSRSLGGARVCSARLATLNGPRMLYATDTDQGRRCRRAVRSLARSLPGCCPEMRSWNLPCGKCASERSYRWQLLFFVPRAAQRGIRQWRRTGREERESRALYRNCA